MTNLLERLKPELALAMNKYYAEYPLLQEEIVNELKNNKYVNELQYRYILDLERLYKIAFDNFPTNVWNCLIDTND